MIKLRGLPSRRVVAHLAGLGKALLRVIGVVRSLEILQVTRHAGRIRAGQVVIVVDVATRARSRRMRTGQWES